MFIKPLQISARKAMDSYFLSYTFGALEKIMRVFFYNARVHRHEKPTP